MTIYQEAHRKIDTFPEETVRIFIQLMDNMSNSSTTKRQASKKTRFLETAGKIDIDAEAIQQLREVSMI